MKTAMTVLILLWTIAFVTFILAVVFPVRASAQPVTCDRFGCSDRVVADALYSSVQDRTTRTARARIVGSRPRGCPRAWCGCWLSRHLGFNDRNLWLARNWKRVGRAARGPAPGVIVIYARGRRGGHVGIVKSVPRPGVIVLLSGNDGGAVRERERSTRGVIAWRSL